MTASSLSITYEGLVSEISRVMGFSATTFGAMNANEQADVVRILDNGYRTFLFPPPLKEGEAGHTWSFLKPVTTLTTNAPYDTGTVTVALGVVTLATGTFPSWAASAYLSIDGVGTYVVSTRDSGSQVTLVDTSVTVASATTYTLIHNGIFTLPDDFGALDSPFTFSGASNYSYPIEQTNEMIVRQLTAQSTATGVPNTCAIRPKAYVTTGQVWEAMFYPLPDAAYVLPYRYQAMTNSLAAGHYALGGAAHAQTLKCAVIRACRTYGGDLWDRADKDFRQSLAASVLQDRQNSVMPSLGRPPYSTQWTTDGMARSYQPDPMAHESNFVITAA